jgi:hypothetical protein
MISSGMKPSSFAVVLETVAARDIGLLTSMRAVWQRKLRICLVQNCMSGLLPRGQSSNVPWVVSFDHKLS